MAAEPVSLRDALFGRQSLDQGRDLAAPTVARYETGTGKDFIVDRIPDGGALLKFGDDSEIWVLTPTLGPRGDIIYKNDVGDPVLRATRLGGLTLFTTERPSGMAAAFVGQAPIPRAPSVLGPEALLQLMFQASARASRAAQHLVEFDAPDVSPASEAVFAQAFTITAAAFARVSQNGHDGQQAAAHFFGVRFLMGKGPSAVARGPIVQVTVAPQLGAAGRPSSERIELVLLRH